MQPVYEASDILEAHIVKGFLAQWGVEAHISGYYLQGGIGELPVSGLVRLWVADEAVETARRALAAYRDA